MKGQVGSMLQGDWWSRAAAALAEEIHGSPCQSQCSSGAAFACMEERKQGEKNSQIGKGL